LAVAGLPAMLYLDPVTFNGLTQTKMLSTAFCCWVIVNQRQSPIQMVALAILSGSALVFQGYLRPGLMKSMSAAAGTPTGATTIKKSTAPTTRTTTSVPPSTIKREDLIWRGVLSCLGAAFLSGLAGALSQKGLQLTGIRGRDPFLYTIEISFYSALTLLFNMVRSGSNNGGAGSRMEWQKQRTFWNWKTLIPIVVKAAGGVITALVHKYAGSVSKGFALMFGLVLSNMIQLTMTQDSLQPHQVVGTIMIMLSTWLHFTNPPI
jgi:solute carrier family 35 (UDP-sugar transporter), member A1/2/3